MKPTAKPTKSCHFKQTVVEFGYDTFPTDCDILYWKMCETKLAAGKRFVVQHIGCN
jgi:hypothetical protein